METSPYDEKLKKYTFKDKVYYTGFANYQDAVDYAGRTGGRIVEVAFKDGNDNPQLSTEAGLVNKKLHYFVDAGPEYRFLHSSDEEFREFAGNLQEAKSDVEGESHEEKYIANGEIEIQEDPIIVLKNGKFDSVTSRERSKYLKMANVYEIAVERAVREGDDAPNQ